MILRPDRKIRLLSAVLITFLTALYFLLPLSGCKEDKVLNGKAYIETCMQEDAVDPGRETGVKKDEISGEASINDKNAAGGPPEEGLVELLETPGPGEASSEEELKIDEDAILFSFTVTGDSRPADDYLPMPDTFLILLGLMQDEESSFNISVGDIINGQTADSELVDRAFSDYLNAVEGVYPINFVSPGNHDIINDTTRKYFREMILDRVMSGAAGAGININNPGTPDGFSSYYYYFKFDDIYFVILNAFEPGFWGAVKDGELKWLEALLEGLRDKAVFVIIHTPPYSYLNPDTITDGSKQISFSDRENLEYLRGLFREYNVDAVFSGHEHVYNKAFHEGTHYIITALAGEYPYFPEEEGGFYHYIRVDVRASSWIYNVIGIDGDLRYREEIEYN